MLPAACVCASSTRARWAFEPTQTQHWAWRRVPSLWYVYEHCNLQVLLLGSQASCVLLDCGHGGMCRRCATLLFVRPPNECPTCRRGIEQVGGQGGAGALSRRKGRVGDRGRGGQLLAQGHRHTGEILTYLARDSAPVSLRCAALVSVPPVGGRSAGGRQRRGKGKGQGGDGVCWERGAGT